MSGTVKRGAIHPVGVGEHITRGKIASETGRSRAWPWRRVGGPHREGEEPKPMMHGRGKSDEAIVAMKAANQAAQAGREPVERRAEAKGNAGQTNTRRTQSRESVSQGLERIREVHCFAVITQGGSRMRESCTYGSVRGALSNGRPYRDRSVPTVSASGGHALLCPPYDFTSDPGDGMDPERHRKH